MINAQWVFQYTSGSGFKLLILSFYAINRDKLGRRESGSDNKGGGNFEEDEGCE